MPIVNKRNRDQKKLSPLPWNHPLKSILDYVNINRADYTREISECYISRSTQDLEFIFREPIRNTMMKNGED
jgi:hypothetical protein